ncbi:CBS domain-containing protein [Candidatus Nitrosotalea bavarica]|uniref:CBS domain-containing protein n=1 Tax=Candidatus Nitrosotalea bavarica TaxID=1903277 RepID=UPI00105434A7|nr:CBS domain-containing protein [Candidatus Nitrosotalea bavarica]
MEIPMNPYTVSVVTLSEENIIHDALHLMQKNNIKRIVIVEKDLPIGIVTERDIGNFLESDKSARNLEQIAIKEIMSRNLVTVSSDQSDILSQCAIRMHTFQISSVIITNGNGKLAGLTTKSDIARNFAIKYSRMYKVKDYMSKTIMTCRKTDSLYFGLDMLNKNKISRLVVTDNDGKAVGLITYDSFLRNSNYFKNPSRNYLLPEDSGKGMVVSDIIGSELIAVRSEDDLAKASNLMVEYKVSGIPVIDATDNLNGVISATDIVKAYTEVETHKRLAKMDPHFA